MMWWIVQDVNEVMKLRLTFGSGLCLNMNPGGKAKVKVHTLDIATPHESSPQKHSGISIRCSREISQFYLHTHMFSPQSE